MTTTTFGPSRPVAAEERRFPLAPAEGWTTLGLVLLLGLTLAWSIDDASWVIGPRGLTDFLAWAIVLGIGWGFVSAKVGWPRWQAHLVGAVFAALLVPMIVGSRLIVGGGPVDWFQATAAAVVDAWTDLAVEGLPFTTQVGHFMLVLGLLAWATGQYAGYVTFHHRRPLNAVIVIGVALVVNMSLTLRDQLIYLVIYSLASLFLLIRLHAYDERTVWIRHRIGDAASLGGLYLRGGSVFVASAVILALFLTSAASSSPLAPLWSGVDQRLIDVGQEVQRVLGAGGGSTRLSSVDFGDSAVISGQWTTDSTPVLDIQVPPKSPAYYWRAVSYDKFNGRAWLWSQTTNVVVPAGAPAMSGNADDPAGLPDRQNVTFTVQELNFNPKSIFAPDTPVAVDIDSRLTAVPGIPEGTSGTIPDYFGGMFSDGSGGYTVTASVPIDFSVDPVHGRTGNELRVAGTDYPDSVKARYLNYDATLIGPATRKLMAAILAAHPEATKSPYDMALSITNYLKYEGGFTYSSDVTNVACGGDLPVECFARTKQGYCLYYASTLALLLRSQGIPARMAEGFLPGARTGNEETILKSGSHAWVEVYFPGYGWQMFDPTGGPAARDTSLPAGPVVSAPPATPHASQGPDVPDPRRSIRPTPNGGAAGTTGGGGSGSGPFIVIGLLLAVAMGGLAFIAWQRGPRAASEPDAVWRSITGLARRFGFAPRPSQTVFEYSSQLGEVIPNARPDLQTVARAKVEVAYGRGQLGDDRIRALRDAQRRLRVALLALVFRRRERRERRRPG
jgi:transglutaminase-like putative cysteine protease